MLIQTRVIARRRRMRRRCNAGRVRVLNIPPASNLICGSTALPTKNITFFTDFRGPGSGCPFPFLLHLCTFEI